MNHFLKGLLPSDSNSRPYITLETITNKILLTVSVKHKSQIQGELPWNAIKNLSISNKIALSGNVDNEVYCFVKLKHTTVTPSKMIVERCQNWYLVQHKISAKSVP